MFRTTSTLLTLSIAATIAWAGPLQGQESTTRGLTVGAHLSGASLTVEDGERNDAGGGGLRVGYGVNRIITLFAQLDGAQFDVDPSDGLGGEWTMGHADFGARFHFANSLRTWVPYLQAALSARAVEVTDPVVNGAEAADISFSGGAFSIGGGLMAYFTETFALDVQVVWSGGEFTEIDVGTITVGSLDIDATSSRLSIGIAWWP